MIIHAKAAHRSLVVVVVVRRFPVGFGIALIRRVVDSNISDVSVDDVEPRNSRLLHPSIKERRAARNFVTSMIGLVRGFNDGLNDQCMVNSFHVDEGRGIRIQIHRDPRAVLKGGIAIVARSGIVESTDTFGEQRDRAPPSDFQL